MNMEIIEVKSWKALEEEILKLQEFHNKKKQATHLAVSDLLFRGHSDAEWPLNTTLERYTANKVSFKEYHNYLEAIKPAIESYTGRIWDLIDMNSFDNIDLRKEYSGYSMMIYVRHHGFPSPLLDWTLSPYIAIYFALSSNKEDGNAALYAFIETPKGRKGGWGNASHIIGLDPSVTSHERHFTQQANYTICIEKQDDKWMYSNHEKYFENNIRNDEQDYIRKVIFPNNIKRDVLKRLDLMNINEYSLFKTEEGLMSMLAFREIKLKSK
jgi:hypothetical protein